MDSSMMGSRKGLGNKAIPCFNELLEKEGTAA